MADPSRIEVQFGGLMTSPAETRIARDRAWSTSNVDIETEIIRARRGYSLFGARTSANANDIGWGFGYGRYTSDAVQLWSLTGSPTSGTVKIKWRPDASSSYAITATIAYNATAEIVESALVALSNVALGDLECTGGPWPAVPITARWKKRYAGQAVLVPVIDTNSLGGGTVPAFAAVDKITGGDQEEWLVALQKNGDTTATMFSVSANGATWTEIATGLTASDWFFQQYSDRIYCCNAVDGLHFKVLGGAWDGAAVSGGGGGGGGTVDAPTRGFESCEDEQGALFPLTDTTTPAHTYAFTGWGTNPTVAGNAVGFGLTIGAAVANALVTVEVTIPSIDLGFTDVYAVSLHSSDGTTTYIDSSTIELTLTASGGTVITPILRTLGTNSPQYFNPAWAKFHTGSRNRSDRAAITKMKLTFRLTAAISKVLLVTVKTGRTMMYNRDDNLADYLIRPQYYWSYAYSYQRVSDGVESTLWGIRYPLPATANSTQAGWWQLLKPYGSTALSGSDKINLYRRDKNGAWRFVGQGLNSAAGASVPIYDKYMDGELASLPNYGDLSGSGPTGGGATTDETSGDYSIRVLGVWKQSMVLGFRRQAWMSYQGLPDLFAPSPDDTSSDVQDEDREDRGVTTYVSDDRSETVTGIVGEDSLYLVTSLGTYAVVGDRPAGSSFPRRLPTSRGGLGTRAQCAFGGGIQVGATDGIWYYSVGRGFNGQDNGALVRREETEEIRTTWTTFAAANQSRIVLAQYNDETWAFNGTAYLMRSRSGKWSSGSFADSVKAVLANGVAGFKFLDARGRIMTLSSAYTTDNGTAIAWSYETGWLENARVHLKKAFVQGAGTPSLQVYWQDGNAASSATFAKPAGRVGIPAFNVKPGFRYKVKLSGTSSADTVESLVVEADAAPAGRAN